MKIPFVDLHAQYLTIKSEIDAAIADVIAESAYIRGRHVEEFEENFAKAMNVKHCVSCGNGTDALYIAMKAMGIKKGDEVITTAHSWISTSETITQAGGEVVFCDTENQTFTIDPNKIESKISKRTVGIIPVHLYGQAADMGAITEIARKYNLWIIEDCAQAHFATFKGQVVGTFGNLATFSFYPGKNLGAYGDAGAIVTNDDKLANWSALFARHGGKGEHKIEGINSRMDGLQAAVLSIKLPHLRNWTVARCRVADRYNELLAGVGDLQLPQIAEERTHVFHLYVIRTKFRDKLKAYLKDNGVETSLNYPKALPFYEAYAHLRHTPSDFPNAYESAAEILSLPIYPELSESMQDRIVECIRSFYTI